MDNNIYVSLPSIKREMWLNNFIKRLFDILVSLTVIILFSPFYFFIAIAIKRDSPGPVLYQGIRVGRHGTQFKMLKFRTMFETKESYSGPKVTAQDDPRITPLGHWLRDTKLNEFPQFWNVLKGEMSLVGPRPEDPSFAKNWSANVAKEVLFVRPGITSPASILYRDEENVLNAKNVLQKYLKELSPDKLRLDQLYVRYRSFWLDLDVILWTALLLLPKIRAYAPPEQLLYVGPISRFIQRYLVWGVIDFVVAFVSIGLSEYFLGKFEPLNLGWLGVTKMAFRFSLIFTFINIALGVNRIKWSKATTWNAVRLLAGWFISTVVALLIHFYMGDATLQRVTLILGASIFFLSGCVVVRYRSQLIFRTLSRAIYSLTSSQKARERVLIIGAGRTAEHIAWLINHPTYSRRFQVEGFVDDDFLSRDLNIYGTKMVGSYKDIPQLIQKYDVGIILLADNRITLDNYKLLQDISSTNCAKLVIVPDVFGALQNLFVTPPFYSQSEHIAEENNSPCSYCLGKYSRLEIEYQIEELGSNKED